jgi:osmotically-inducible protein OsmY
MQTIEKRSDLDIQEDIEALVRGFAPLKASRGYFSAQSVNGKVILKGNVRNPQARRVLLDNVPHIPGVALCDASELYDDEMIRFAVGQLLPPGISSNVHYGSVALVGKLPDGVSADAVVEAVSAVKGVRRVANDFTRGGRTTSQTSKSEKVEPVQRPAEARAS